MTGDYWEPVSHAHVWCPRCHRPSPPLPGPDEAITWDETHLCAAAVAAA